MPATESSVLYVGTDDRVAAAVRDQFGSSLVVAGSVRDALDRLADVDVVVTADSLPDGDALSLLRSVRDRDSDLPVVVFPVDGSERLASDALAAGATDYLPGGTDATTLAELADRVDRARRSASSRGHARIAEMVRGMLQDVVESGSREEIERLVCEHVADAEPYVFAWFGEVDETASRVVATAAAGFEEGYLDDVTVTIDESETGRGPTGEAVRTCELQVVQNLSTADVYEPWRAAAAGRGFRSSAAVPVVHEGVLYGVLNVYADRVEAFDEVERRLLEDVVDAVAHAIHSVETRARLREREAALTRETERLEKFASVLSHDLRNPLNVARGYLDLAREECDSDHLEDVDGALERIEQLVGDVLALARQGQVVSDVESTSVADVAADAWGLVSADRARLEVGDLDTVEADPERLQTLLENLFRNAIEHAGPDVTVRLASLGERDGFAVADDGPGVAAEEKDRIFESGYSTAADGTGFGLAIVREIAEAHGWTVDVAESDRGGARFEVVVSPDETRDGD